MLTLALWLTLSPVGSWHPRPPAPQPERVMTCATVWKGTEPVFICWEVENNS
jgi:hypothetical protein